MDARPAAQLTAKVQMHGAPDPLDERRYDQNVPETRARIESHDLAA